MGAKAKLYLMRNSVGNYKIGVSVNPESRRSTLQCASGLKIEIVGVYDTVPCAYTCEKYAHRQYSENRLYGEWFDFTEDMLPSVNETLESICSGHSQVGIRKQKIRYKEFSKKDFVNPCLLSISKRFIEKPSHKDADFLQNELEKLSKRSLPLNEKECEVFNELSDFFKSAAEWSMIEADWARACRIAPRNGRIKLRSRDTNVITRLYYYLIA